MGCFPWPGLDLRLDPAKAMVGFARPFPMYTEANVGHPSSSSGSS
jgi:hypothetical protein